MCSLRLLLGACDSCVHIPPLPRLSLARSGVLGSDAVLHALDPHRDHLNTLFGKYVQDRGHEHATTTDGLGLRNFMELVKDAGLLGAQL
eukprot:80654-Prymnesium_polylepis.1